MGYKLEASRSWERGLKDPPSQFSEEPTGQYFDFRLLTFRPRREYIFVSTMKLVVICYGSSRN
jgi:hypothetical protein